VTPFWFLILSLATYRLVRLALYDTITQSLRDRIWDWLSRKDTTLRDQAGYLLSCHWCLGVHAAFWVTLCWFLANDLFTGYAGLVRFGAVWFALAASQSVLHVVEDFISEVVEAIHAWGVK